MVWGREFWLILFHVGISSGSQRQLLKSSVLSSLNYVDSFVENEWPLMKGLCLNSPFCFIDLCIYLDASTTQMYDCSYVVSFEIREYDSSSLVILQKMRPVFKERVVCLKVCEFIDTFRVWRVWRYQLMFFSRGPQLYTPSRPTVRMCSLLHLQQHVSRLLAGLGDLLEEPYFRSWLVPRTSTWHLPHIMACARSWGEKNKWNGAQSLNSVCSQSGKEVARLSLLPFWRLST